MDIWDATYRIPVGCVSNMQFSIYKQFSSKKIWRSLYILHIYCIYIYRNIWIAYPAYFSYLWFAYNAYNACLTCYCIFKSTAFSGLRDDEVTDPDLGAKAPGTALLPHLSWCLGLAATFCSKKSHPCRIIYAQSNACWRRRQLGLRESTVRYRFLYTNAGFLPFFICLSYLPNVKSFDIIMHIVHIYTYYCILIYYVNSCIL